MKDRHQTIIQEGKTLGIYTNSNPTHQSYSNPKHHRHAKTYTAQQYENEARNNKPRNYMMQSGYQQNSILAPSHGGSSQNGLPILPR